MVTIENYAEKIKSIDVSALPDPLKSGHAYVEKFMASGTDWGKYHSSPTIKETVDVFLKNLNEYIEAEVKSAPEKGRSSGAKQFLKKKRAKKEGGPTVSNGAKNYLKRNKGVVSANGTAQRLVKAIIIFQEGHNPVSDKEYNNWEDFERQIASSSTDEPGYSKNKVKLIWENGAYIVDRVDVGEKDWDPQKMSLREYFKNHHGNVMYESTRDDQDLRDGLYLYEFNTASKEKVVSKKPAKTRQAKPKAQKPQKKQYHAKQIEKITPEVAFIKRYLALDGKTKTHNQILTFLTTLQKALLERVIIKSSPYAKEIETIQTNLILAHDTAEKNRNKKVKIELSDVEHLRVIAFGEQQLLSIKFLKRYISLKGRRGMKAKAKRLLEQSEVATTPGPKMKISPNDPYWNHVVVMKNYLRSYLDGKSKEPYLNRQQLNGFKDLIRNAASKAKDLAKRAAPHIKKAAEFTYNKSKELYKKAKPHVQRAAKNTGEAIKRGVNKLKEDHAQAHGGKKIAGLPSKIRFYDNGTDISTRKYQELRNGKWGRISKEHFDKLLTDHDYLRKKKSENGKFVYHLSNGVSGLGKGIKKVTAKATGKHQENEKREQLTTDGGKEKFNKVLEEFRYGVLRNSKGGLVTNRKQALAIAFAEGKKVDGLGLGPVTTAIVASAAATLTNKTINKMNGLDGVMNSENLKNTQFDTMGMEGPFYMLMGDPAPGFKAMIYGPPKHGKSTLALKFAKHLAMGYGPVLYVASEEGIGPTLKEKLDKHNIYHPGLYVVSFIPVDLSPYKYVFIDSLNKSRLRLEDIVALSKKYPEISFIYVLQSTKDGGYAGGTDIEHEMDIVIKVEDGIATQHGRYRAFGEIYTNQIHEPENA
jgi:hypothetical protein